MNSKPDCAHLLEDRDPSRILRKILAILEHQVTKDDIPRQIIIIDHYIYLSRNGYLVKDLSGVMLLAETVLKRKKEYGEFEETVLKLLNIYRLPPILTRNLELLICSMDIKEYFSWLGYMIVWMDVNKEMQSKVIEAIFNLLTAECEENKRCLSRKVRIEAAHSSRLPDILAELIEIVDYDIYYELLEIILILLKKPINKTTIKNFLRKGVLTTIIVRLEPSWMERFPTRKPDVPNKYMEIPNTETIFCILPALLIEANTQTMKAPSKFTLWSLQWAFRTFAMKEQCNVERNNVLAVLLLLMDIYPDLLVGNLTFAYDIAMLAMSKDIIFHPNWTSDVKLTTTPEDHCCIALLFMCISYFPNCLYGPKVIEECRVVMGLLKLITQQQTIKWHPLQSCYLIRLSMIVLLKIIPASTEEFIEDGGPSTILNLLTQSRENKSMYGYDIVLSSVELLAYLCYKFKSIRDSVEFNGGFNVILNLSMDIAGEQMLAEPSQKLLITLICLLQEICSDANVFEVLPLIINYMKRLITAKSIEPVQNPTLIIVCLSFIWNKIAIDEICSGEFLKMNGIYFILDIIDISSLPVRLVALGTLIDLCDIVQCIPYLITWRKRGIGIKSLLMEVFRAENKQICTKTDENGLITDHKFPMMGQIQFFETFCVCDKHTGNAAIGDMFISCRPKIYCLLQILNVKEVKVVEIANEYYNVYNEKLSLANEVTYLLAENYLAIKLGEEWKEIGEQFRRANLKPIPLDEETLNSMFEITDKWSKDLQKLQQEILTNHQLKQHAKEQKLYNSLKTARLTDAWSALCEIKYIARCSERLFRVTSNFNLQNQISNSLKVQQENGQMHKTFQSNISVTCMHNQNVIISNEGNEFSSTGIDFHTISPISSTIGEPLLVEKNQNNVPHTVYDEHYFYEVIDPFNNINNDKLEFEFIHHNNDELMVEQQRRQRQKRNPQSRVENYHSEVEPLIKSRHRNLGENGTGQRMMVSSSPEIIFNQKFAISEKLAPSINTPILEDKLFNNNDTNNGEEILPTDLTSEVDIGDDIFKEDAEKNNYTIKHDSHVFYNSTTFYLPNVAKKYWVDFDKEKNVKVHDLLSNSHRRGATVKISFEFPFYGNFIKNVTVATGGFIYTGLYVHSWLAATQYVAPLMANFDTSKSNLSFVKYYDNGTAFTVEWSRVSVEGKPNYEFTFQTTLFKNGDIVFVYKDIPESIKNLDSALHPVKIGLSDAYILDRIKFLVRRKTIFEYHRVTFNQQDIKNWTTIYLKALPTCQNSHTCADCMENDLNLNCTWCPILSQCSTGLDRNRQLWLDKGCDEDNITSKFYCNAFSMNSSDDNNALNYNVDGAKEDQDFLGQLPSRRKSFGTSSSGGSAAMFILFAMLISFGLWTFYAYRYPQSTSGQILIRYRPSQWRWRRGEARYTAATIHM